MEVFNLKQEQKLSKNLSVEVFNLKQVCMRFLCSIFLISLLIFFSQSPIFAQTSTPSPQPQTQSSNEFTVQNEPSAVVTLLQDFIEGFDSFLGGFIFYTPNPLADKIVLKDGSEIPGVTKYRNMFYQIAIPVLAIIIAGLAITKLGSDNAHELKSFALRFILTIVLFITIPSLLSYSIQFNNLLVEKISSTQQFTGFLNNYFDQTQQRISQNENPEKFGIPSFDMSMRGGIFRSVGKFIVQVFLFALTFLFLLGGFIYIGFQFIIRFATLLFLGVIYPIVLPFALSERTEQVVQTFLKSWFTFLIQQPAFVLGFSIATDIFSSILNSKGPSVGMLFFYTGFLFFLGGVNMLVGRIFGDIWSAFSTNMQAAVSARSVSLPVQSRIQDFKRGLLGGNVSSTVGRELRHKWQTRNNGNVSPETNDISDARSFMYSKSSSNGFAHASNNKKSNSDAIPPFSQDLSGRGLQVQVENPKQGVVSVTGEGYRYDDPKTGLASIYPTRLEAIQDGVPEAKLQATSLDRDQFIDLSSFNKLNHNPHNYNAMQESKRKGKALDYAYINESSPPQKVKHFLEVSRARNEAYGVKGVIVKRQGVQTSDQIIRMYTHKSYEKRKNI